MTLSTDDKLVKHTDGDEAMKAFDELQGEAIELDDATNRRLLRRIDLHIMPIMCLVYAMNFLDSMSCRRLSFRETDIPRNYPVIR